jgi:uncharacterized protein
VIFIGEKNVGTFRDPVTFYSQNKKLFGVMHLPKEDAHEAYPTVVFCHGLASNKSGKTRLSVRLADELASVGIASLRFDFRGCGDSEGEFTESTLETMVEDTKNAIVWLGEQPFCKKSEIGILGRSFGGLVAALYASRYQNAKALVLWAPVFDGAPWFNGEKTTPHILSREFIEQFRSFDGEKELKLSQIPLLHIVGKRDTIVEKYHKEQYQKLRDKAEASSQFLELEDSDHTFSVPEEQPKLLNASKNWFRRYLC